MFVNIFHIFIPEIPVRNTMQLSVPKKEVITDDIDQLQSAFSDDTTLYTNTVNGEHEKSKGKIIFDLHFTSFLQKALSKVHA